MAMPSQPVLPSWPSPQGIDSITHDRPELPHPHSGREQVYVETVWLPPVTPTDTAHRQPSCKPWRTSRNGVTISPTGGNHDIPSDLARYDGLHFQHRLVAGADDSRRDAGHCQ